jgi:hypothetical protein
MCSTVKHFRLMPGSGVIIPMDARAASGANRCDDHHDDLGRGSGSIIR